MPGPVFAYRLEPARTPEAGLLAVMAREQVESGLRASWDAARIAWHIRHPDSVVLAARAGTAIAGFAIMRYGDDSAHLNLLAVAPSHRRRGIARRLMNWLEGTALTAGTFTIGLELRAGNLAARAFYASLGYRELGSVPGYYQGVESAIRMERDLRSAPAAPGESGPPR
ncbi:MAG: GNAT family N-acetyltransferase [Gammaproteobacteria bacterium]|nr:MAG: GNAT family N-acetyltransferase [Gammaproteobacteria bacterium]TLZ36158.1 MAG: GNAT family N-acetyltransferase [Gammaproteobacteria bacterium]TLZ51529.1 MAG: GNAT family N-acetyltransferase [Gammaproteobacteria bacterium]